MIENSQTSYFNTFIETNNRREIERKRKEKAMKGEVKNNSDKKRKGKRN